MIFVLKGADFSANNLGQVELTTGISEFTKDIILKSGNTSMTMQQKSALDSFFRAIGAFGDSSNIWSKIDMLVMPLICTDLEHASVDYTGKHTITKLTESHYTLRNHGITGTSDSPTTYTSAVVNNVLLKKGDFSLFTMITEDFTEAAQNSPYILSYIGNSGSNRLYCSYVVSSAGGSTIRIDHLVPSNTSAICNLGIVPVSKGSLQGLSVDSTGTVHYILNDTIKTIPYPNYDEIGVDTAPTNSYIYGSPTGVPPTTDYKAVGMTIYAKYLSDTEMTTLYNAANKLASYFLV